MTRKISLFLVLFFLLLFLFPSRVLFAVNTPAPTGFNSGAINKTAAENIQKLGEADRNGTVDNILPYVGVLLNSVASGLTYMIAGDITSPNNQSGALNTFGGFIATMYANPPAGTGSYIQYIANNAGFPNPVPAAYAASPGFGFKGLTPILPLWTAMRNISYFAFAVLFVVIGMMIIFRVHIDPKTVITVQSALPRIFLTLILITFSYPIAGLLIDFMYVILGVFLSLLQLTGLMKPTDFTTFVNQIQTSRFTDFIGQVSGNVGGLMKNYVNTTLSSLLTGQNIPTTGDATKPETWAPALLSSLAGLYFSVTIIFALIKTFLSLITAYATILFMTILSPLVLLGEAIPGNDALVNWIKNLTVNLLVFPLVIAMVAIGNIITGSFQNITGDIFVPPLLAIPTPNIIAGFLGYVVITTIPHAIDLLNEALKVKPSKATEYWKESLIGTKEVGGKVTGALTRLIPI